MINVSLINKGYVITESKKRSFCCVREGKGPGDDHGKSL